MYGQTTVVRRLLNNVWENDGSLVNNVWTNDRRLVNNVGTMHRRLSNNVWTNDRRLHIQCARTSFLERFWILFEDLRALVIRVDVVPFE